MQDKHLRKCKLVMTDPLDFRLFHSHHAFRHCRRGRQALRLSDQASFADKLVRPSSAQWLPFLAWIRRRLSHRHNSDHHCHFDAARPDLDHGTQLHLPAVHWQWLRAWTSECWIKRRLVTRQGIVRSPALLAVALSCRAGRGRALVGHSLRCGPRIRRTTPSMPMATA